MNNNEKLEKYRQSGQSFCPYLFLHYHLDTDKATKLCCHATDSINGKHVEFNDQEYKSLRTKTLNGERLDSCSRCYEAEDSGFTSLRQRCIDDIKSLRKTDFLMEQVQTFQDDNNIQPAWYDLRLSNNCNLTCIMCGPMYSSTWAKEAGEENAHLLYEPDVEISPNTYKIQLAGGEPFMIKKFSHMLSNIDNLDCEIVVNTNATIVTKPLLDQLKRFKNVWIVVSIDGYDEINTHIRRGSNWNTIVGNIKMFQECGFTVLVNTVLQKDNINHIYELGDFLESVGIKDWIISPLFVPENLKWENQQNIDYDNLKKAAELSSVQRNENSLTLLEHIIKEKP
jgi:sulfatase maturation enzyme AslB (radical SAM superfamily)